MAKLKADTQYENNPFNIGLSGLTLLFSKARSVAIFAIVLISMGLIAQLVQMVTDFATQMNGTQTSNLGDRSLQSQQVREFFNHADTTEFVVFAVVLATTLFIYIVVSLIIVGIFDYTSARLSEGKSVTFGEALKAVLPRLAGYLWFRIVLFVKILLWSLLLIVPGIIMAVRYSLAGTVYFREEVSANQASRRSADITKGAWFTTFASYSLWNLMTLGLGKTLLSPGTGAILYKQLAAYTDGKQAKPDTHWLSWLTFFVPIVLTLLILGLVFFLFVVFSVSANLHTLR